MGVLRRRSKSNGGVCVKANGRGERENVVDYAKKLECSGGLVIN